MQNFDYDLAFSRTLGWITKLEREILQKSTVAIAGLGGVGGVHLLTLARLGIGGFHISDMDEFEIQNFNRQVGADMTTIGQKKVEVMRDRALAINPKLRLKSFPEGIHPHNIDAFLEGVDVYVDGLDVFELNLRETLFKKCAEKNITVISVGPIGMGSSMIAFTPRSMSFEDYFGFDEQDQIGKYCRFVVGLAPGFLHLKSLVDRSYANAYKKRAPSTPMGCQLASGVIGTEVLKHLLDRGPRLNAPWTVQFDAYSYRIKKTWTPFGHRNPLFKLKVKIFRRLLDRAQREDSSN